jgi:hypothetical protein
MNDFISKPVDMARLTDVLARWLPASAAEDLPGGMSRQPLAEAILKGFLANAPSQ